MIVCWTTYLCNRRGIPHSLDLWVELRDLAYIFVVVIAVAYVAPCLPLSFFCVAAAVASFLAKSFSNPLIQFLDVKIRLFV
jgi:hypothetical protein